MTETVPAPLPLQYGTFTSRMIASIIDLSIVLMVALPLTDVIIGRFLPPVDTQSIVMVTLSLQTKYQGFALSQMVMKILGDPAFQKIINQQRLLERTLAENMLQLGFIALYILPFWFRHSATPGKMLFRLEIRDEKSLGPISDGQAVGRFFAYILSLLPFSLGFVWIAFNGRRRGFHDYIAKTIVVVKPKSAAPAELSSAHQSEDPSGSQAQALSVPEAGHPAFPPATE